MPIVLQFLKLRHDFMIFSSNHVRLFETETRLNTYRAPLLETETRLNTYRASLFKTQT